MLSKSSWSFTDRGALGSIFQWPTSEGGRMEGTLLGVHKTRRDVLTDPCLPPLLDNPNCWAMQQLVRMPNLKVTWKIWGSSDAYLLLIISIYCLLLVLPSFSPFLFSLKTDIDNESCEVDKKMNPRHWEMCKLTFRDEWPGGTRRKYPPFLTFW